MITTFIAEQGGVGKTSLCFNLAWYLASQGKKILMIDLDAQGSNLSFVTGMRDTSGISGIYEILMGEDKIENCIYKITPNISLIPANNNAKDISKVVEGKLNSDYTCLKTHINRIKNNYDYVFLDTNPTPSDIHIISLVASDDLIIPLLPDAKSIEGTKHVLETYKGVKDAYNKDLEVKALVYNKSENRTTLSKYVESEIKDIALTYNVPVAQTKIPQNVNIAETIIYNTGITDYKETSKGAKGFFALSKELFNI